jgi:cytoskeletal protein CcmA (bactofilin family)
MSKIRPWQALTARVFYHRQLFVQASDRISVMAKIIEVPLEFTFLGEIRAEGSVRLRGRFEGNGLIKGSVYIASGAYWEGNLICDIAIVRGEFHGDLAAERIFLVRGASCTGSIVSNHVQIQTGAFFTGAMRMRKVSGTKPQLVPAAPQALPRNLRQIGGT